MKDNSYPEYKAVYGPRDQLLEQDNRSQALQNAAAQSTPAVRRSRTVTPVGPSTGISHQEDSAPSVHQVPEPKPINITTSNAQPRALSPRTVRRNMLQTELTAELRQNLLWERQQKKAITKAENKHNIPHSITSNSFSEELNSPRWAFEQYSPESFRLDPEPNFGIPEDYPGYPFDEQPALRPSLEYSVPEIRPFNELAQRRRRVSSNTTQPLINTASRRVSRPRSSLGDDSRSYPTVNNTESSGDDAFYRRQSTGSTKYTIPPNSATNATGETLPAGNDALALFHPGRGHDMTDVLNAQARTKLPNRIRCAFCGVRFVGSFQWRNFAKHLKKEHEGKTPQELEKTAKLEVDDKTYAAEVEQDRRRDSDSSSIHRKLPVFILGDTNDGDIEHGSAVGSDFSNDSSGSNDDEDDDDDPKNGKKGVSTQDLDSTSRITSGSTIHTPFNDVPSEEDRTEQGAGLKLDCSEESLKAFEYTDVHIDQEGDDIISDEEVDAIKAEIQQRKEEEETRKHLEDSAPRKRKAAEIKLRRIGHIDFPQNKEASILSESLRTASNDPIKTKAENRDNSPDLDRIVVTFRTEAERDEFLETISNFKSRANNTSRRGMLEGKRWSALKSALESANFTITIGMPNANYCTSKLSRSGHGDFQVIFDRERPQAIGNPRYNFESNHKEQKHPKVMRACESCRKRRIKCDAVTTNAWPCPACIRLKLDCKPPTVDSNILRNEEPDRLSTVTNLNHSSAPHPHQYDDSSSGFHLPETGTTLYQPPSQQQLPPPKLPPPLKAPPPAPNLSQTPAPNPIIPMLVQRASQYPELQAVMEIVAAGQATKEQLEFFQGYINELTNILQKQKEAATKAPPPLVYPGFDAVKESRFPHLAEPLEEVTSIDPSSAENEVKFNAVVEKILMPVEQYLPGTDNQSGEEPDRIESEDDDASVVSSYAASVFSVQSLASSASVLSKGSGYSALQIATATKELVTIFQQDQSFIPLYMTAIEDPGIGPVRLQRNLRRLFKKYAENLEEEAKDRLEYLAARLVSLKARFVAQAVIQWFTGSITTKPLPQKSQAIVDESSDDDDDDDKEESPVNDVAFEDMVVFREFLVGSDAFQTLRAQLEGFVLPKPTQLPPPEVSVENEKSRADWEEIDFQEQREKLTIKGCFDRLKQALPAFYIATGQLEPPLSSECIRLRWQCRCGDFFAGDVKQYQEGGLANLVARLENATGGKVYWTTHNSYEGDQKHIYQRPGSWLQTGLKSFISAFKQQSKACTLPQHNDDSSTTIAACSTTSANPPEQKMLHLSACMHKGRFRKSLHQDRIDTVSTDRKLFCFLRQRFTRHRGRFSTLLSLKTVTGIFFIKFRLPMGGSVEVRHHNPCCYPSCECIPPRSRVEPSPQAEYRCIPGPPEVWPPIDPTYLAHLFTSPNCVNENDTWILDQLPKRTCGELHGKAGQPAEGWGIYYQESWDRDVITLIIFVLFLMGSLLFGVLWSKFQMDIQGAFSVSSYMVTACGILVSLVAMRVDKV